MSNVESTLERGIAGLKFGSDLVADAQTGEIKHEEIATYAEQIAVVNKQFSPVIFTSGAAVSGKAYLESEGIDTSEFGAQELAGAGTDEISKAWKKALIAHRIVGIQVLANHDQMKQGSVLMRTLLHGIGLGIVYIINENDQENVFELELYEEYETTQSSQQEGNGKRVKKPGVDNDFLAARGMVALKEELAAEDFADQQISLALFTAVGGFMLDGAVQPEIHSRDRDYLVRQCDGKSNLGTGGMEYKLDAAFLAAQSGVVTRIASPQHDFLNVLKGVDEEGASIGTRVLHDATIG
jgi:glutamate 5-kinase